VPLPPEPKGGGAHSPAGEGLGESQKIPTIGEKLSTAYSVYYSRWKNAPGYVDGEEGKPAEYKAPNNDADRLCCFRLHFELSHLEREPALDCNIYFFKGIDQWKKRRVFSGNIR